MTDNTLYNFTTYIVSYSGGKDSTATLLWAIDNLPREKLRVVFADTTVEWPETYQYLNYIEDVLEIKIDRIQAGDFPLPPTRSGRSRESAAYGTSFYEMVRLVGRWPMARYRFCNTYLKRWPLRLYAEQFPNPVQIEGTRREESSKRANKPQFEPHGRDNVHGGGLKSLPIFRPVIDWTKENVWNYLKEHEIRPNPVYNYAIRCGCWLCPMARRSEVLNFCRVHPEIARTAVKLEQEINHCWRSDVSLDNLFLQAQMQMMLW